MVGEEEGRKRWEDFTVGCVKVSTLPFMLLLLPQIIRNGANMAAGRLSALIILSWTVGHGLLCFALLCFIGQLAR